MNSYYLQTSILASKPITFPKFKYWYRENSCSFEANRSVLSVGGTLSCEFHIAMSREVSVSIFPVYTMNSFLIFPYRSIEFLHT